LLALAVASNRLPGLGAVPAKDGMFGGHKHQQWTLLVAERMEEFIRNLFLFT